MGHKNIYFQHPRKFGPGSRSCRVCGNGHGLIRKYGLNTCRQCFRENAKQIGFKKIRRLVISRGKGLKTDIEPIIKVRWIKERNGR